MMKRVVTLAVAAGVLGALSTASAGERFSRIGFRTFLTQPPPAPEGEVVQPMPMPETIMPAGPAVGAPLYHCVKYEDRRNIAPCAVTKIVAVKDPCACSDPCNCCQPKCVYVAICVPPCACECVKYSRGGSRVKYDYGKYEVEITSKDGVVEVDYDD